MFDPLIPPRFAFVVTFPALVVPVVVRRAPDVAVTGLPVMAYLSGIVLVRNVDELPVVSALNPITASFSVVLCAHIDLSMPII